jgi:hypothetical protein
MKDHIYVSMLDMSIIMHHLYKASLGEVGYHDLRVSLPKLTKDLQRQGYPVRRKDLESALYACNMLSETKQWGPVTNETFPQFTNRLFKDFDALYFDRDYNQIRRKND